MGVVDVVGVEQRMKWCVDRRRRTTRAEAARVVVRDEVVLGHAVGVQTLERPDPVEVEQGEPSVVKVPRSPPEPLTTSTAGRLTGHRVGERHLGRRVAAGEVGDPPVGAESARPRQQRLHLGVESRRHVHEFTI